MKLKGTSVAFLLLLFLYLGLLSGAIPVLAGDEPGPAGTPEPSPSALAPAPTDTPVPTAIPTPAHSPVPTEEPRPTAPPPEETILATTITGDSILDNDTGYAVDAAAILASEYDFSLPPEGYQVLIIHTHSTEAYTPDGTDVYEPSDDHRTTDINYSVVRVGRALEEALEAYGLNVLHDEGLYDYPSYTSSYVRSGAAIEEYLDAYPGIFLVIDLHRDALGEGDTMYKTVTAAEGVQAAQLMFVLGSDATLEHPRWRDNLSLALTLQNAVTARYPSLMRPVNLCSYRYNQQLTPGSLLLEVGTAGNTLQEAITGVQLFAEAVGPLLLSHVASA